MRALIDRIPDKPVYFELRNQLRRFVSGSLKGNQVASLVVILIFFSMIAYSSLSAAKYIPLSVVMFILPGLAWLTIPGAVSGLISGELQKRSLDPLLASPLRPHQLVTAKALRALPMAVVIYGSGLGLIVLLAIGKLFQGDQVGSEVLPAPISIVAGTIIFLATAYSSTGLSLAVSSVTRTTVASLLTCFGAMLCLYALLPAVVVPIIAAIDSKAVPYVMALHPYGALSLCVFTLPYSNVNMVAAMGLAAFGTCIQFAIGWLGFAFAATRIGHYTKKGTGVS
ncbi:MAG: hypothetical protein JSS71_10925 [Armatimonadetes bacterium]|nr:hypothetical protein [Armatimonadota bacterium]MBX3107933.1 hypothetical protein [Fimbriimonadaceae bacterium]